MWIGIDDTDSRHGGCTTHLSAMIISQLQESGIDLIGYPRLVRLNPNIPWKTRGNGAVSFQIGFGHGKPEIIGKMNGVDLKSYPSEKKKRLNHSTTNNVKTLIRKHIRSSAQLTDENTNPGLVIVADQFPESMYWNAVQKVLKKEDVISLINGENAWFYEWNNGRGIIGASSSIAWRGRYDYTFELISYRKKKRWGSTRLIEPSSVILLDKTCSSTFDNFDYKNDHVNIMPHSPCPILFGIRGDNASELEQCMNLLRTESFDDWLLFSSNQGTDDHIIPNSFNELKGFQSVSLDGIVEKKPVTKPGGHVIFSLSNGENNSVDCAAYEPTKQFRSIIRQLEIGDKVRVYGGIRVKPFTINLEKIKLYHCVDLFEKVENPVCQNCGKHMKSKGKDQGYFCKKCKTKEKNAVFKRKKRNIHKGFYEVPVCARRHLSKPLKRMNNST